ncbi:MAG: hypothetical protein H6807_06535 [Planctomycetes bacterium]|nr:hypothetical protein [Planctomycetota bacterium]
MIEVRSAAATTTLETRADGSFSTLLSVSSAATVNVLGSGLSREITVGDDDVELGDIVVDASTVRVVAHFIDAMDESIPGARLAMGPFGTRLSQPSGADGICTMTLEIPARQVAGGKYGWSTMVLDFSSPPVRELEIVLSRLPSLIISVAGTIRGPYAIELKASHGDMIFGAPFGVEHALSVPPPPIVRQSNGYLIPAESSQRELKILGIVALHLDAALMTSFGDAVQRTVVDVAPGSNEVEFNGELIRCGDIHGQVIATNGVANSGRVVLRRGSMSRIAELDLAGEVVFEDVPRGHEYDISLLAADLAGSITVMHNSQNTFFHLTAQKKKEVAIRFEDEFGKPADPELVRVGSIRVRPKKKGVYEWKCDSDFPDTLSYRIGVDTREVVLQDDQVIVLPATQKVTVLVSGSRDVPGDSFLLIESATTKQTREFELHLTNGSGTVTTRLPNGVYFLRVEATTQNAAPLERRIEVLRVAGASVSVQIGF